jgi:hypothetical protein
VLGTSLKPFEEAARAGLVAADIRGRRGRRVVLAVLTVAMICALAVPTAMATVKFHWIDGFDAPDTPDNLDRVGILKVGPKKARNVLVLNPGTSASAAYFKPLASFIVKQVNGWQVWAVERRENQLEAQSVFDQAKEGVVSTKRMYDYYLGWMYDHYLDFITDPTLADHFERIPDDDVAFARGWGLNVAIEDLRRVVQGAKEEGEEKGKRVGGKVVLGGHSLGSSITTAYATWEFNGRPRTDELAGLVFIDGGSDPTPQVSEQEATQQLQDLEAGSPWLSFGGIPTPLWGLLNTVGSTGTQLDPNGVGELQTSLLLSSDLKPPLLATNQAMYGYALDAETSPPTLVSAQAHLGHLAASGGPRAWDDAGELTSVGRYARMFSGTGLESLDGTAWYHPMRLSIDSGAVAAGNANPAQQVLDVHATHGDDLKRKTRIYAFGTAYAGQAVLDAAKALADQSGIPDKNLTLVNRVTYAHLDAISAFPDNDFVSKLTRFLEKIEQ